MSETPQRFDCKEPECDSKVIYEPQLVVVYRGANGSRKTAPAASRDRVIRVYLSCERNHRHEYSVEV